MNHEELLRAHLEVEMEGCRSPSRPAPVDPRLEETIDIELLAVQRMLDLSRFKRLMSIRPQEFGQLAMVERRNLLRAAEGFSKRFDEICGWMGRNVTAEAPLPSYLRERAAI